MVAARESRDPLELYFRRSGVQPLPWDVHHTFLWTVHPEAEPHRSYVIDAFAGERLTAEQRDAAMEFLHTQAREYLRRRQPEQATRIAMFGKSLATTASSPDEELAFASLVARARWGDPNTQGRVARNGRPATDGQARGS